MASLVRHILIISFFLLNRNFLTISSAQFSDFKSIKEYKGGLIKNFSVKYLENRIQTIAIQNSPLIIGLGESTHGSNTIQELVFEIIKYQISHNNCKLVLIEFPLEETLFINDYVQGAIGLSIKDLVLKGVNEAHFSVPLLNFLEWLRSYNQIQLRKVQFLGTDISRTSIWPISYLRNYVILQKKYCTKPSIIYQLLNNLNGRAEIDKPLKPYISSCLLKIRNAYEYIKKYKFELGSQLGIDKVKLLEHILKRYTLEGFLYNLTLKDQMRDSLMAENVELLRKMYIRGNETTIIYSHLMHTNKKYGHPINRLNSPSMGSFLKAKYKDNYFVIGILVGEGQVYTCCSDKLIEEHQSPPQGSLERLFLERNTLFGYFELRNNFNEKLIRARPSGCRYNRSVFYKFSPNELMDAILFIKKSSPLEFNTKQLNIYE